MAMREVIDLRVSCFLNDKCSGKLDRIEILVTKETGSPLEDPIFECDTCGKKYWNYDFQELK